MKYVIYIQYLVILEACSTLYIVAMQDCILLHNQYLMLIINIRENKEIWNVLFASKVIEMWTLDIYYELKKLIIITCIINNIFKPERSLIKSRLRLYNVLDLPTLLHGSEC